MGRVFASRYAGNRVAAAGALLLAGLVAAYFAVRRYVPSLLDPVWLRETVAGFGPWAPAVFVVVQTVQVVAAPIPGQTLAAVGGYLFGGVTGAAYSLLGVVAGSAVAFVLSRRYGRPLARRVVDSDALTRFDAFAGQYGVVGLLVLFLLPTFPDDLLCFVAGLTDVRLRTLLALVVVGRGPSFLLLVVTGDGVAESQLLFAGGLLAPLAIVSLLVHRYRERVAALDVSGASGGPDR
jgi:uncharacterized membrane protein YdjX (TVP38/TMEM64 family)